MPANKRHLAKLKEGTRKWNNWRKNNPDIKPNLSGVDLRKANLKGANFSGVNLQRANLNKADLRGSNFTNADLREAKLCAVTAGLQRRYIQVLHLITLILFSSVGILLFFATIVPFLIFYSPNIVLYENKVVMIYAFSYWIIWIICSLIVFSVKEVELRLKRLLNILAFIAALFVIMNIAIASAFLFFLIFGFLNLIIVQLGFSSEIVSFSLLVGLSLGVILAIVFGVWVIRKIAIANKTFEPIKKTAIAFASIEGTNFEEADLTDANFTMAILKNCNFRNAIVTRTNFYRVQKIEQSVVDGTILTDLKVLNLIVNRDVSKNYIKSNLKGANLVEIDFRDIDLTEADLSEAKLDRAKLQRANLTKVRAIGTNFKKANLTAACIENWKIDETTNLDDIVCDYIYKNNKEEKYPISGKFQPGEFKKLFQESARTVDLIFSKGVNWKAFAYSFEITPTLHNDTEIAIDKIEHIGDGSFRIVLKISPTADDKTIHDRFMKGYDFALEVLDSRYRAKIENIEQEIARIDSIISQNKTITEEVKKQRMVESRKIVNIFLNSANIGALGSEIQQSNIAAKVENDQIITRSNYKPLQKETLAEAAAEIQQHLDRIQTEGFTPEEAQGKVARTLAHQAENNLEVKNKLVKWAQSLGDTAAKTTVTEAVKEVFKLALRILGIPIA